MNHGNEEQYIFARFLQYCASNKHSIMGSLAKFRRAAIYCDLILHLSTPKKPPKNTQIVFAYLDSPVVMDVIGLGGKRRKIFAERMLRSFNKLLFTPYINRDMISEIQNNIRALLTRNPRDRFGPTADAIRAGELKEETVKAILDRLESVIEDRGVKIDRFFETNKSTTDFGDDEQRQLLSNLQSNYAFIEAAERDVRTIRGVYCKRGKSLPDDLFSSRAIFVTSNNMLATVANRFFRDRLGYKLSTFPVVVTRPVLAALSDAIIGVESSGSMSVADMLISAADATQYNVKIFEMIETHLRAMRPEDADDLMPLLENPDYARLAMDAVQGNPRNVTVKTIDQITSNIESSFEKAANEKVRKTVERMRRSFSLRANTLRKQSEELALRNEKARNEIRSLHGHSANSALEQLRRSKRKMKFFEKSLRLLAVFPACLAFGTVYTATDYVDYLERHGLIRFIVASVAGLFASVPFLIEKPLRHKLCAHLCCKENQKLQDKIRKIGFDIKDPIFKEEDEINAILESYLSEKLTRLGMDEMTVETKRVAISDTLL